MNRRGFGLLLRSVASVIFASCLVFQVIGPTRVSAQATAADVASFLADPTGFLANYSAGTADNATALTTAIQNLALAAASQGNALVLPAIMSLVANASSAQQSAMAAGLGSAAAQMGDPNNASYNPSFAQSIQSSVASANLPSTVMASYSAAAGGSQTASTGGGGGGGGANPTTSSQPGGGGGGGSSGTSGSTDTSNSSGGLTGGGTTGSGSSGSSTTASSVSPH